MLVKGPRSTPFTISAFVAVCRVLGLAPRPPPTADRGPLWRVLASAKSLVVPCVYLVSFGAEMWSKVMEMEFRGLETYVLDMFVEISMFSSTLILVVSFWTTKVATCTKLIQQAETALSLLSSRDEDEVLQSLSNQMKPQFAFALLYTVFYLCKCFSLANVYSFLSSLFWNLSGTYLIAQLLQFANMTLFLLYVLRKINGTVAARVSYEQVFFTTRVLPLEGKSGHFEHDAVRSRYRVVKEMSETLMSVAEVPLCLFLAIDFISVMLLLYAMTQVETGGGMPSLVVMSLVCCICFLSSFCVPCHLVARESRRTATLLSGVSLAFPPASGAGVAVASLLLHVAHNPVTFSLLGTISLNFHFILSFVGTIISYLLVLVTFRPHLKNYVQLQETQHAS